MWSELADGFIWKSMDQPVLRSLRGERMTEDVTCCSFSFIAAVVIVVIEGM